MQGQQQQPQEQSSPTPNQQLKLPEIHNHSALIDQSQILSSGKTPHHQHLSHSLHQGYNNGQPRVKRTLHEAKKARKKLEQQAQLLANRIALLKQQQVKTWKKIQQT